MRLQRPFYLCGSLRDSSRPGSIALPERDTAGLKQADTQFLRAAATRTWRYFSEWSSAESNWLIPDNVREERQGRSDRLSPTNLGFLLNARIAAVHFGYLTVREFADDTLKTLEQCTQAAQRTTDTF